MDAAIGVIAAVVTILLMMYQRRVSMRVARKQAINDAAGALAETLQVALDAGAIDSQDCLRIMGLWGHMLIQQDKRMKCACGNVALHCDKDKAVMAGITHTTKFCDTEDGEDE